jgi:hypothetical protein
LCSGLLAGAGALGAVAVVAGLASVPACAGSVADFVSVAPGAFFAAAGVVAGVVVGVGAAVALSDATGAAVVEVDFGATAVVGAWV